MAHKISTTEQAITLLQSKPVSLDTLASAIVRGKGLNLTDNKAEFFKEYSRVTEELTMAFGATLMRVVEPERYKKFEETGKP